MKLGIIDLELIYWNVYQIRIKLHLKTVCHVKLIQIVQSTNFEHKTNQASIEKKNTTTFI